MSGEGSVDNQLLSEPKIEETCPLEDQSEQVPLSDTNFIREKSCSDFKQDDNYAHLSKEAKEPKKITEIHIRKNPNLKSSIPRLGNLASARTSSTTARPSNITSPHSLTSNRKLESSLKTLQPKPNVKERQSLIKSPSKLKPNSSQKPGSKSLTRPLNRSRPTSPMHDASPTRIYISEKKKFDNILNELVEKQGEIFKIHTKLTNLKDKVSLTHKDLLQIKDLKLVDLSELLYEKNLHMEGHAVSPFQNTSDGLLELEKRLHTLPVATLKFCEDTLFQRESIIHWLRSVFDSDVHKTEEFSQDLSERIETYETEGLGLIENMQALENHQRELIGGIAKDYSTLFSRAQKLQDDNVRLKKAQEHDTYTLEQQIDLLQKENIRLTEQVTETANTLDNEREQYKREIFNKTNMDRTIYNEKNRVNDLKNTIKSLELKVTQFETKYKELVMASKKKELSKADSDSVKKTRELQQYKEQVELMNQEIANQKEEHDKTVREFTERIYRLEVGKAEETELKEAAQAELKNKTHHLQNLQQQYASLSELVEANEAKNKTNDQDSHAYMVLKDQVEKLMEEVAVKDEQIVSLNAKMREFDRDMRDDGSTYSKSLCAKIRELEETVSSLKTQLEDADNTLRDTVKEKEVIETNLMKKSLELEQRDLILKEKTKIAELREELVTTLKSKEQNQEVCVQKLKAAIMVKESENEILAFDSETSKQTNTSFMDVASSTSGLLSEMSIRSKRAAELYTNLEQKHMELVELQRRVQELETRNDNSEKLRIRHEARINHLEQALGEKCLTQPGRGGQSDEYFYCGLGQYLEYQKHVQRYLQKYYETIKVLVTPGGSEGNKESESCQEEQNKLLEVKRTAERLLEKVAFRDREIAYLNAQLKAMQFEKEACPATEKSPLLWRIKSLADTVASLHLQLESVETKLMDTVKEKDRMKADLIKKTIELEQRDNIAFEQSKVYVVREKLVSILRNKELDEKKDLVDNLLSAMTALRETNSNLFMADGTSKRKYTSIFEYLNSVSGLKEEMLFRSKKTKELHTHLENKNTQITHLHQRLQELEKKNNNYEQMRIIQEAHISELEKQLNELHPSFQFD